MMQMHVPHEDHTWRYMHYSLGQSHEFSELIFCGVINFNLILNILSEQHDMAHGHAWNHVTLKCNV